MRNAPEVASGLSMLRYGRFRPVVRTRGRDTELGWSAREGIEVLRGLVGLDIIAVDVNTVSPAHDVRNVTAFLAAQVIYESLVLLCQKPS